MKLHGAEDADGEQKDGFDDAEAAFDHDADEPQRQQDKPDDRVEEQRHKREGPAGDEKDQEDEKFEHRRFTPASRVRGGAVKSSVEVQRLVAVDWSGDKGPGQRKKIWAGVWTAATGKYKLENGRSREELAAWLIEMAEETPRMVVSIDCCFSYPAWFLREHECGSVFDFWRHVAAGHGERWLGTTCEEHERDLRFWGRPHKRPAVFCGDGYRTMMRMTDWENKIEQGLAGGDAERAAKMKGITPKSPFQIGGSGSVGTGSLRAMPWLLHLRENGFRVWPFEDASLAKRPLLVEMYTRLLTGAVKKSNALARKEYLRERRKTDVLYAGIGRTVMAKAEGSEDAFDALVCCAEMVRWQREFAGLRATQNPTLRLEGITWRPGVD